MKCDDYRQDVSAFLDEERAEVEIRDLFRHPAACDGGWTHHLRLRKIRHALTHGAPLDRRRRTEHETSAARRRVPLSAPSLVLSLFAVFLFGILLSLMLPSRTAIDRPDPDLWQTTQLYRYLPWPPSPRVPNPGTGSGGIR